MTNLLILETSARNSSISAALAYEFAEEIKTQDSNILITTRSLDAGQLANLNEDMTAALRAGVENPSHEQQTAIERSDDLIAELENADMVLIAAPMHNFTISAQMRTWLDYVIRPGKTFGYSETGPKGLLADKPVYIFSTRGGQYGDASPEAPNPYDFQSGYLRHILGFIGLTSVEIIAANGMDMGDDHKAAGLAEARSKINALIASGILGKAA